MPDIDSIQVLISYRQLEALLSAARELEDIRSEVKRCHEQIASCRKIQTETLEKYQELYQML